MGEVLAVVNQKGGVGKSTTTVNLGSCMAVLGQKILIIDIDPQGNTTSGLGVDKAKIKKCIYNMLVENVDLKDVVAATAIKNVDIVPATIELAGAEIELVSSFSRETKLRRALEKYIDDYNFIIIDCPPSLGLLTLNALTAAHKVLVPIQCEYYALEGLGQLMQTIKLVQKHLNAALEIEGVVLTMFDARTNLGQQVIEEVRNYFKEKVFATVVPRNVRLSEAPSFGLPINIYDENSKGAQAYMSLAKEVLERAGKRVQSTGTGG